MQQEVKEYINQFPEHVQDKLQAIRQVILSCHSDISEGFGYKMPAYKLKKPLIYFAAYANHIGIYPGSSGILAFQSEFIRDSYIFSKGAVQIPMKKELPLALIKRIVLFKIGEQS